jgi:hypothetical protein
MATATVELESIPRRQGGSPAAFLDEYASRSRAVILTDAITGWPALRRWSLDFFEQRYGDRMVGNESAVERTKLGEGIRRIRDSLVSGQPAPYLHQIPIPRQLPELHADISPPIPYVTRDRMGSRLMPRAFRFVQGNIELFIGGPRAGFSLLHYDLYHQHAFIAQVVGEKHFRVFSPRDSAYVYPDAQHPHTSRVTNAFEPDLAKFPEMARATPIDFVLRPGEVLFVPAGWWHVTRMSEVTISVAWNTLDQHNWPGFVADYRRGIQSEGIRGQLKAAYVQGLGALFRARGM